MAERKMPSYSRKLTLSVGLISVPIRYGTFARDRAPGGSYVCPEHLVPAKQGTKVCSHDGHLAEETVLAYQHGGRWVTGIDRNEHKAGRDGILALEHAVDVATLDPALYERTHLLWPDAGGETPFDLIAETLRASGKALIGKAVLSTSTKAIAIRWSELTGTLVAHVLTYDANLAWADIEAVRAAREERPEPSEAHLAMAEQLLETLGDEFDFAALEDDYAASLSAAIEAAAAGQPVAVPDKVEAPTQVVDLMDALKASVAAAQPKKRKKVAA
jgi:DNA end-binding protein Ku